MTLEELNITQYHYRHSLSPFLYLGFYMVDTIAHRNWRQYKLLSSVQVAAQIYSARQLSLRGRATIINTLIMTKVWYCLRLLQPTQESLNPLQTIIYNFVWQNKRLLVAFQQLSLPFQQGGLSVLKPHKQVLALQVRHLRHLFCNSTTSKLVQPFIQYHMSLINTIPTNPTLSFFVPELRHHLLNHPTSIIHALYTVKRLIDSNLNQTFHICPFRTYYYYHLDIC